MSAIPFWSSRTLLQKRIFNSTTVPSNPQLREVRNTCLSKPSSIFLNIWSVWKSCLISNMCNPSPAKILRNVKRMTKFLEHKASLNPPLSNPEEQKLSITILPNIDISPAVNIKLSQPKKLSVSKQSTISILSQPRKLTLRKFFTTEIVLGARWEDDILFSSYIVGGTHTTTFVCNICYVTTPTNQQLLLGATSKEITNKICSTD